MNKLRKLCLMTVFFIASNLIVTAQSSDNSFNYSPINEGFVIAQRQNVISSDSSYYSFSYERIVGPDSKIGAEPIYRKVKRITWIKFINAQGFPDSTKQITYPDTLTYDSYVVVQGYKAENALAQLFRYTFKAIQAKLSLSTSGQNNNILNVSYVIDYNRMYQEALTNPAFVFSSLSTYSTNFLSNAPTNSSFYETINVVLKNTLNVQLLDHLPYNISNPPSSNPTVFLVYKIYQSEKGTTLNDSKIKVSYKVNHLFNNAPFSNTISTNNLIGTIKVGASTVSSGSQLYLNTKQEFDIETNSISIGSRKFRRWQLNSSDFTKKSTFFSDINILRYQAQFDYFKTLQINNTSVEGSTPSFTFQNPWELEADGYTQLNEPKTYSGNQPFQVFVDTNPDNDKQESEPTYVLNKGAVTGSNGIEYFVLGETATGATFHQAQSPDETIVTFSGNATINRTYKAKNHSTVSNVVGLDNRRLVDSDGISSSEIRVYESAYQGVSRIWVQFKSVGTQNWTNEFLLPLCESESMGSYSFTAARNPRIATTRGNLWVVYEALDSFDNQWRFVATLVHNVISEQRVYQHKELFTTSSSSSFNPITSGMEVSISGDNTAS